MASKYEYQGTDLDELFEPLHEGEQQRSPTGYVADGVDLSEKYAHSDDGEKIDHEVGYAVKVNDAPVDLRDLFAKKGTVSYLPETVPWDVIYDKGNRLKHWYNEPAKLGLTNLAEFRLSIFGDGRLDINYGQADHMGSPNLYTSLVEPKLYDPSSSKVWDIKNGDYNVQVMIEVNSILPSGASPVNNIYWSEVGNTNFFLNRWYSLSSANARVDVEWLLNKGYQWGNNDFNGVIDLTISIRRSSRPDDVVSGNLRFNYPVTFGAPWLEGQFLDLVDMQQSHPYEPGNQRTNRVRARFHRDGNVYVSESVGIDTTEWTETAVKKWCNPSEIAGFWDMIDVSDGTDVKTMTTDHVDFIYAHTVDAGEAGTRSVNKEITFSLIDNSTDGWTHTEDEHPQTCTLRYNSQITIADGPSENVGSNWSTTDTGNDYRTSLRVLSNDNDNIVIQELVVKNGTEVTTDVNRRTVYTSQGRALEFRVLDIQNAPSSGYYNHAVGWLDATPDTAVVTLSADNNQRITSMDFVLEIREKSSRTLVKRQPYTFSINMSTL